MIEYVDNTPDTSLMDKISKTGYKFSETIAEFIDNAIDEPFKDKPIKVDVTINQDFIKIVDNGRGMNKQKLIDAMTLAKCSKSDKLGMYGFGLKTASISLGKKFEVITNDGEHCWKTWWDSSTWSSSNAWKIPIEEVKVPPYEIYNHGTIVKIEELKVKMNGRLLGAKMEISDRFAYHIKNGLNIIINKKKCEPVEKKIIDGTRKDFSVDFPPYGTVYGWIGLLERSSQKYKYGFRTYRNNRMITENDKYGFSSHPTLSRIFGEVHLDFLPVTINKRDWERSNPLWNEVEERMKKEFASTTKECRLLMQRTHIPNKTRQVMEKYKEGIVHALSSPELDEYVKPERNGRKSPSYTKDKKDVVVEKRQRTTPPSTPGSIKPGPGINDRQPKNTHIVSRNQLTIKGKTIDYTHDWQNLGKDGPIYDMTYNADKRELEVYTNSDFPSVKMTTDIAYHAFVHLVDAVAQLMVTETGINTDKKTEIYQSIMRNASTYITQ